MGNLKGLFPIREPNGQRSRRAGRPTLNMGLGPAKKRRSGLIAHTCAIYVIEGWPDGVLKIGSARNVASRLEALQVGQSRDLTVFGAFRAEEPAIRKLETSLHKRFAGSVHHVRGELYSFKLEQAHAAITDIAREMKIVLSDDHQYPFGDLTERLNANIVVSASVLSGVPRARRIKDGEWLLKRF